MSRVDSKSWKTSSHAAKSSTPQDSGARPWKLAHQLVISVEALSPSDLVHVHLQGMMQGFREGMAPGWQVHHREPG